MRIAISVISLFFALSANASVFKTTVMCKTGSGTECSERTLVAFEKLGCRPIPSSVNCRDAATDPMLDPSAASKVKGKEFCDIQSDCHEPNYGNFGQVSCNYGRSGEETLNLKKVSSGITLTTSVGLFRSYVTTLCK